QSMKKIVSLVLAFVLCVSLIAPITVHSQSQDNIIDRVATSVLGIDGLIITMTNVHDRFSFREVGSVYNFSFMLQRTGTITFNKDVYLTNVFGMSGIYLSAGEVFRFEGRSNMLMRLRYVNQVRVNTNVSFYLGEYFGGSVNNWDHQDGGGGRLVAMYAPPEQPPTTQPPTTQPPPQAPSNDTVLVTIGSGQIYEIRNLTNSSVTLTLERGANTFTDHIVYRADGTTASHQRGGWVGAGTATQSTVTLGSGWMLVIQHRTGGNVTVRSNNDNVQVRRLTTPVFYTQMISYGVTVTFNNNSLNSHFIDWGGGRTHRYNNNSGELFGLVRGTRFYVDGTEEEILARNLTGGQTSVPARGSVQITGNFGGRPAGWSREIYGTHTAFSGQAYRLTIDGQRSYPPGTTATPPEQPQTPPTIPSNWHLAWSLGQAFGYEFYFDRTPISSTGSGQFATHTVEVGTTMFAVITNPDGNRGYRWWSDGAVSWTDSSNNQYSARVVFNTVGNIVMDGGADGRFYVNVVGTTPPTTQPPTTQPPTQPPANNQIPQFVAPPSSTDNGVLIEFNTVPNNRFGYRIFRATTATGDGISITDFPIMVNPAHSLNRIITFDPNVRPNRDYWYYIREVLEEARFDAATTTLIPEVLGPPSARIHVRTSAEITEPTAERGFIMMFIGNSLMNVNNVWEGIDPPQNNTAPVLSAGRTMVPIRAIVEAMGGTVGWDNTTQRIDLRSHGNHVQMWLGQRNANVNGATREMDVIPQLINDRTLIPVRFVAEFLGAQIEWIGSQQMVVIVYYLQ
ncbi:MAG: copper amine oxidase N-terminal domain-containing protein, partial [Defluviitaleaceae bacterium]|nr:copper amine oxidase N-terminal domain-containing protein [Defluviitaleaceae bacterium]